MRIIFAIVLEELTMALTNTTEKFGSLTKILHWTIFTLFVVEFYLVYQRSYFADESPLKAQFMFFHKSIGVLLLLLAVLFLFWRHVGKRPSYISTAPIETLLAKLTHFLLYVVLLVQPLSGMLMSLAGGYKVPVFGLFTIQPFAQKNEALGDFLYQTHVWTSYFIIGLVSLHALAALFHHFVRRDRVLTRMM